MLLCRVVGWLTQKLWRKPKSEAPKSRQKYCINPDTSWTKIRNPAEPICKQISDSTSHRVMAELSWLLNDGEYYLDSEIDGKPNPLFETHRKFREQHQFLQTMAHTIADVTASQIVGDGTAYKWYSEPRPNMWYNHYKKTKENHETESDH